MRTGKTGDEGFIDADGYVFICEFDEWTRVYDRDRFLAWLNGAPSVP